MTSRTPSWPTADGSDPHPGIDLLADLSEELTDPADLPALRQHLADCAECADTYAALAEVRELLSSTETPPMPADVAERIDAALAVGAAPVEAARLTRNAVSAPPSRTTHSTGPGTLTGSGPGRRRRRRGRILLGAAALAATLTLGVLVVQQSHPGGGGDATATAANGGVAKQHPALAQGGPVYREDHLGEQIRQLLSAAKPTPEAQTYGVQPRTGDSSAAARTEVPSCLPAATGHTTETPLAVGSGRYGTEAVTALVYPLADQPGQVDVYLVTPDCPGATVLLHRTVPTH
ncbi:hypothetical protein GCM10010193_65790 [Kitasatospora atroaurantiaca]|uniref:Uncharacterized protein n=1 Tax=Kitasatospora atroaurantiaca TaxID=285545 RepID=A0A561ESK1_9ACTN|nr:hypothetical protein [Kitasatospora atroaurantiaca]TWE18587.1 hypothetical protein FB465_3667 [Kitasatospora atroaurantiaca]